MILLYDIEKGCRILDKEMPGWKGKIDKDRLNMMSCSDCILGQLYGDYWKGKRELQNIQNCGFEVTWEGDRIDLEAAYHELTEEWRAVLL